MGFDTSISTTVSLHRVLDYFLENNEKPGVILDFLSKYSVDELSETLFLSDHVFRLFSIDFVQRCTDEERKRFFDLYFLVYGVVSLNLYWSLLMCKNLPRHIRMELKDFKKRLDPESDGRGSAFMKYPLRGRMGSFAYQYESRFAVYGYGVEDYANILNSTPHEDLAKYAKLAGDGCSLMIGRFLQNDVFTLLSETVQYILISQTVKWNSHANIVVCMKQILNGCCSNDIKRFICGKIRGCFTFRNHNLPEFDTSCENFNQLMMKLELSGNETYCDWILFQILIERGLDYFKGCSPTYKKTFEDYFNIAGLIDENDQRQSDY